jgi:hypothetical protein
MMALFKFKLRICLCALALTIWPGIAKAATVNFSFNGVVENSRRYHYLDSDPTQGVADGEFPFFTEVMPFIGSLDIDDQLFGAVRSDNSSVYVQPLKFDFNIDRFSGGFGFSSASSCLGLQTVENDVTDSDPAAIYTANKVFDRVRYTYTAGFTECDSSVTELNNGYTLYEIHLYALDNETIGGDLPDMLSNSDAKSDVSSLIGSADALFFELIFKGPPGADRQNFAAVIGQLLPTSQVPEPSIWLLWCIGLASVALRRGPASLQ